MKKVFCLLLVVAMVLSLCACGVNKEDMAKEAIDLNWREVYDEYLANEARAKALYDGKIVKWTAKIYDIRNEYVTMANETYNGLPYNAIDVYLNKEDIIKLDKYKEITVVGELHLGGFSRISNAFVVE